MARHLKIAAAQLGPLHREDSRAVAVSRLTKLLRDAHAMGAKFVVFPELALTTFFPRWWIENQAEVDARYFEKSMPSRDTQPLFDEAKKLGIGFYIGYAELTPEGRRFNTAILVGPDGSINRRRPAPRSGEGSGEARNANVPPRSLFLTHAEEHRLERGAGGHHRGRSRRRGRAGHRGGRTELRLLTYPNFADWISYRSHDVGRSRGPRSDRPERDHFANR